jgi:sarcosine oxidase
MRSSTVIIAGLGAAGSAAAWRLAAAGHRVIGLDRWRTPHAFGSTHGETRVTRITAWEGAQYVPLAQRANALFDLLEKESGMPLRLRTGGLFIGFPHETIIAGTTACADGAGVPYEVLTREEILAKVHGIRVPEGMIGVIDPGAGVLLPEPILEAMHASARHHGAELRFDEPLESWRADGDGVEVRTAGGTLRADRLILATGAWMVEQLAPLQVSLTVERQTLHWFDARRDAPVRPVLIVTDGRDHATVIFPTRDGQVKAAGHGTEELCDPDTVDRSIRVSDIAPVAKLLDAWLPGDAGMHRRSATCLYTRTPSGHFILDHHPEHPQVILASPCNGYGFKFASAVGEGLASLATGDEPSVPLTPWRFPR